MFLFANSKTFLSRFNKYGKSFCIKTNKIGGTFDLLIKDNFSPEDHAKILDTLNESSPEELSRYKISNIRIKGISDWKKKRGPFKSISEVLEIDGFGEKKLQEICEKIAFHNIMSEGKYKPKQSRHAKNLLVPDMTLNFYASLQSAVAIHLDPTGIGWARLERNNNTVTDWKFKDFSSLPTKMLPSDTFNMAINIIRTTPTGDAYIFEAPSNLSPQSQAKQGLVSTHNQQVELLSMLLALLNTSVKHNISLQNIDSDSQKILNRVFYLKNKVSARLFNTLIGFEKVSAISEITGIVKKDPSVLRLLPCTPVSFSPTLNQNFLNQSSTNKELLAQALMLGISFMDLCIHKNSASYEALRPNHHRKKDQSFKPSKLG